MTTFRVTNSHQLAIVVAPVIGVTLATLCVILRFRARRLLKQSVEFDDWLCLVALVSIPSTYACQWSFRAWGANDIRVRS